MFDQQFTFQEGAVSSNSARDIQSSTSVSGVPRIVLRLEGLAVLGAAAASYGALKGFWPLFAMLFLLPDLSMAGYLAGARIGAISYNIVHSYVAPAAMAALMAAGALPAHWDFCLIWVAHIGFDRAVGYGLKFASGFRNTHLGTLGSATTP